jgi:hypothetical protein
MAPLQRSSPVLALYFDFVPGAHPSEASLRLLRSPPGLEPEALFARPRRVRAASRLHCRLLSSFTTQCRTSWHESRNLPRAPEETPKTITSSCLPEHLPLCRTVVPISKPSPPAVWRHALLIAIRNPVRRHGKACGVNVPGAYIDIEHMRNVLIGEHEGRLLPTTLNICRHVRLPEGEHCRDDGHR